MFGYITIAIDKEPQYLVHYDSDWYSATVIGRAHGEWYTSVTPVVIYSDRCNVDIKSRREIESFFRSFASPPPSHKNLSKNRSLSFFMIFALVAVLQ